MKTLGELWEEFARQVLDGDDDDFSKAVFYAGATAILTEIRGANQFDLRPLLRECSVFAIELERKLAQQNKE